MSSPESSPTENPRKKFKSDSQSPEGSTPSSSRGKKTETQGNGSALSTPNMSTPESWSGSHSSSSTSTPSFSSLSYHSNITRSTPNTSIPSSSSSSSSSSSGSVSKDIDDVMAVSSRGVHSYIFGDVLGSGAYATVYKGFVNEGAKTHQREEVAIKLMKVLKPYHSNAINREKRLIWNPNPNIIRFIERFTNADQTSHYIVSELAPIGDLYRVITQTNANGDEIWVPLKPQYCRHLIRGIALGVQHLFSLGISHGDIKHENVLMCWDTSPQRDYNINRFMRMIPKLTDFNNSEYVAPRAMTSPRCSLVTAAPESYYNGGAPYDMFKADVYSVGSCLLSMLMGCYPFEPGPSCPRNQFLKEFNRNKKVRAFIREVIQPFDYQLRQVLLKVLEPNPENRITIEEFLADNWFTQRIPPQDMESLKGSPKRVRKLSF